MNPGFLDYQVRAHETAIYPEQITAVLERAYPGQEHPSWLVQLLALDYAVKGLAGEAGEVANKAKKIIRDAGGELTGEQKMRVVKELGGVLWYLAETASVLGLNLADVAKLNLAELADRKARGKLRGDGDDR